MNPDTPQMLLLSSNTHTQHLPARYPSVSHLFFFLKNSHKILNSFSAHPPAFLSLMFLISLNDILSSPMYVTADPFSSVFSTSSIRFYFNLSNIPEADPFHFIPHLPGATLLLSTIQHSFNLQVQSLYCIRPWEYHMKTTFDIQHGSLFCRNSFEILEPFRP